MKSFKKLILATAIIAASSSSFAMQAMDDESLSSTTGQDGITITASTNLGNLDIKWVDRDGAGVGYTNSGAVVINSIGVNLGTSTITIDAGGDAGDTTGNGQLAIGIALGNATINLASTTIEVADADATGSATGTGTEIIKFGAGASLTTTGGNMNIKLGNRTAGDHFITMNSTINGVALSGLTIIDNGDGALLTGGEIGIGNFALGTITSVATIDVIAGGLSIDTTGTTIASISLENVQLGTVNLATRTNSIGDIYVTGAGGGAISMGSVITISGH